MSVRSRVLLPLCGPPTTTDVAAAAGQVQPSAGRGAARRACRRCRPAPAGRRCSVGSRRGRPRSGSPASGPAAAGPACGGSASGGSHTWCAGGPARQPVDEDVEQRLDRRVVRPSGRPARRPARRGRRAPRTRVAYVTHRRSPSTVAGAPRRVAAGSGPDTYAALNRVSGSVPILQVAVPGRARQLVGVGRRRARPGSPSPRTSAARCGTTGGSPARASGPRPGAGEASSRCTPSERPSRPICTNMSMKSGWADSSSLNSSTMTSRLRQRGQRRRRRRGPARTRAEA